MLLTISMHSLWIAWSFYKINLYGIQCIFKCASICSTFMLLLSKAAVYCLFYCAHILSWSLHRFVRLCHCCVHDLLNINYIDTLSVPFDVTIHCRIVWYHIWHLYNILESSHSSMFCHHQSPWCSGSYSVYPWSSYPMDYRIWTLSYVFYVEILNEKLFP